MVQIFAPVQEAEYCNVTRRACWRPVFTTLQSAANSKSHFAAREQISDTYHTNINGPGEKQ